MHPVAFGEDHVEKVIPRVRIHLRIGPHGLGRSLDGGERRVQLVGNVGDELPAALVQLVPGRHVVNDEDAADLLFRAVIGGVAEPGVSDVVHLAVRDAVVEDVAVPGDLHAVCGREVQPVDPVRHGKIQLFEAVVQHQAVLPQLVPEEFLRADVGMEHCSVRHEGHHGVAHAAEHRVELLALPVDLVQRGPEPFLHVVEILGQNADFVRRADFDLMTELPGGDELGVVGQALQGGGNGLRKEEGEKHRDQHADDHGLNDDRKEDGVELPHLFQ